MLGTNTKEKCFYCIVQCIVLSYWQLMKRVKKITEQYRIHLKIIGNMVCRSNSGKYISLSSGLKYSVEVPECF